MNKQSKETNGVKREMSLSVHKLNDSEFGKSVTLMQETTITYPSKRMDTGFGKGLFNSTPGKTYTNKRYALIKTPEEATEKVVEDQLSKVPNACIYRILSNDIQDIITDSERAAIKEELTSLERLEDRYEVQDSEGNRYAQGKLRVTRDGEVIENMPKEFKRDVFSTEYKEDIDLRQFVGVEQTSKTDAVAFSL